MITPEDQLRYFLIFNFRGQAGLPDPLVENKAHLFLKETTNLTKVSWGHFYNYLFEPPGPCTLERLKPYS